MFACMAARSLFKPTIISSHAIQPPLSSCCKLCSGELRLKRFEPANRTLDLENEMLVCANCGREQSYTVDHDHNTPHPKVA